MNDAPRRDVLHDDVGERRPGSVWHGDVDASFLIFLLPGPEDPTGENLVTYVEFSFGKFAFVDLDDDIRTAEFIACATRERYGNF